MSGRIHIGTSGWNYTGWSGIFYPEEAKPRDFLGFYSGRFSTVEVNYSFYHLPRTTTYERWVEQTPDKFLFTLKLSRFITHIKRLKEVKTALRTFVERSETLGSKRGPLLIQLPPSFSLTDVNLKRIRDFLENLSQFGVLAAVELRHNSWFVPEVYKLFENAGSALVIANSSRYPNPPEDASTADFVYFRFHGPQELFASSYTDEELKYYAKIIRKHKQQNREVYVYFNNDFGGHAVRNALTIKRLLAY